MKMKSEQNLNCFIFSPCIHSLVAKYFIQVKTKDNIKDIHHAGRQLLLQTA